MSVGASDEVRYRLEAVPRPADAYVGEDGTVFDPSLQFLHPTLAEALAYWDGKRGAAAFPGRRDIDPLEIPHLLRHVLLMERVPVAPAPGYSWRYRLIGTTVAALYGEHTGKLIEDALNSRVARRNRGVIEESVKRHAPMRAIGRTRFYAADWLIGEALVAPLSSDGALIDMIFSVVVTWAEGKTPDEVRRNWQHQKAALTA